MLRDWTTTQATSLQAELAKWLQPLTQATCRESERRLDPVQGCWVAGKDTAEHTGGGASVKPKQLNNIRTAKTDSGQTNSKALQQIVIEGKNMNKY